MGNYLQHRPSSNHIKDLLKHYLGDIIYGANDGLVTTFAIVSSIVGADFNPFLIIVLGFANLVADGVSMGSSRYLSIRAKSETSEYSRGMLEPLIHALYTFAAFVLIGAIPLFSFLIPAIGNPFLISAIATGLTLFMVGAMQSFLGRKRWLLAGLEMLMVGALAASCAYSIGVMLRHWL